MPNRHHTTRSTWRIIAATLLTLAFGCSAGGDSGAGSSIEAEELAARIASGDAPLILDVRSPSEFAAGHLPGARNIAHDVLAERLGELSAGKNDEIVVHCHSGRRAESAENVLRQAGYTNVRDLTGHWRAWKEAGLPSE